MKIYINTANHDVEVPIIEGELFIPGEWKHVPDTFLINQKIYPYIKEAQVVLAERIREALVEKGLDAFAQGLKEAAVFYGHLEPAIVADVQKYTKVVAKEGEVT